jgi:CRP-like cAMP-binding protein
MRSLDDKNHYLPGREKILFFRALRGEACDWLWKKGEVLEFDEGEPIVQKGDHSPSFFGILAGNLSVSMPQNGKSVYLNTLGEGQLFGEAAMFLKTPRTADVTALETSVVLKLTRFDFLEFLKNFPVEGNKALLAILYGLLHKLRTSNQELAFERRNDDSQDDVDALVAELTSS